MEIQKAGRGIIAAMMISAGALYGSAASAGSYSDQLGKCLVTSSDSNDQILLVQWMFAALSLHPAVQPLSNLTPAQRDVLDHRAADLVQRLLFQDCRQQTIDALKNEGEDSMRGAFQTFGDVAGRGLVGDPRVRQAMESLGSYLDPEKMVAIGKAAGLAQAPDVVGHLDK